jgi:FG-GAP repeat
MSPAVRNVLCSLVAVLPCGSAAGQTLLLEFIGDSTNDQLGEPVQGVSGAGDVNGDGYDDVIVGVWADDHNGVLSGAAMVYSGLDGALLHTFLGQNPADLLGSSVDGAGDVNGDGYDDLIVGAWGADGNGDRSGNAKVFSGLDGSVLHSFDGDGIQDLFGWSVSGAGDVNGDGYGDIIVGAPVQDEQPGNVAYARVFSGFDGAVLYTFTGASMPTWERFGSSVAGAGDVNGDGNDDLVVGSWYRHPVDGLLLSNGEVFSGADGSSLYLLEGNDPMDWLGHSVAGAGDVNGDGYADVILGGPYGEQAGVSKGMARVFSGFDGTTLYTLFGDNQGDFFGRSVSGVGDMDLDGFDDFVVGAPFVDYNGVDAGMARVFSGVSGAPLFTLLGDSGANGIWGPWLGSSVGGAGDVDGDGVPDLIVSSPRDNTFASSAGAVRVYSGTCQPLANYCTAAPNSTGSGARMFASGSQSVSTNNFGLHVAGAPPGQFGLFFYGPYQAELPFGDGFFCVAGGTIGLFRVSPPVLVGGGGSVGWNVDFTQPPAVGGPGGIFPGSTWNFQFWYRDPGGPGGSSFNFSDALSGAFCR